MKKIDLLLTRHGETIENQRHVLQGQLPGTLSPLGKEQAVVLAEQLKQEPLDVIVCSDLARSYDTAKVVAGYHGKQPQPTPLLREMDWGICTLAETLEDVDWEHLPRCRVGGRVVFIGAEEFVNYLRVKYAGKCILAVGHGAFNRAILTYLNGGKPADMVDLPIMENTSVIRLSI